MKTVVIKSHRNGSIDIIQNIPDGTPCGEIVEKWARDPLNGGGCTWRVCEKNDLISAMVEGSAL